MFDSLFKNTKILNLVSNFKSNSNFDNIIKKNHESLKRSLEEKSLLRYDKLTNNNDTNIPIIQKGWFVTNY